MSVTSALIPTGGMTPAVAGLVEHVAGGGPSGPPPGLPVLSTIAAYVAVAGAGLLVAPLLTRVAVATRLRSGLLLAAGIGYVALLAALFARGESGSTQTAAAALAVGFGAIAAARRSPADQAVAGAVLIAVQAQAVGTGAGPTHLVVISVHLGAAAVWLGGVLHLALFLGDRPDRPQLVAAARRFTRVAVTAGGALAATGLFLVVIHHVPFDALPVTGFGRVVIAKSLLLAGAAALGLAHRFGPAGVLAVRRLRLLRVEAGVLSVALGLAVILVGLPDPHSSVDVIRPGLALVQPAGAPPVTLFAVSTSTTGGAVQLGSSEPVALVDRATGRSHQVLPGETVPVVVRGGNVDVDVVSGSSTVRVRLAPRAPVSPPTGEPATADVTGWTAYQLGRALAGPTSTVPVASVTGCGRDTRATGAAVATRLRANQVRRVYAVTDRADRSRELLHGVSVGGVRVLRRPGPHDVLIATGAAQARQVIERLSRADVAPRAIYLAPWLLDGSVLQTLTTLRAPAVLVVSTLDALSPSADRYRDALASFAPGVAPSAAGLLGYLAGTGETGDVAALHVYAAAPIGFLPSALEAGHDDHEPSGWFANGSVVSAAPTTTLPPCPSVQPDPDPSGVS